MLKITLRPNKQEKKHRAREDVIKITARQAMTRKYLQNQRTLEPPSPVLRLIAPRFDDPSPRSSDRAGVAARLPPNIEARGCSRSQSQVAGLGAAAA